MTVSYIVGQLLLGWLLADLLGGIAHWLQDRVLTEETPLVGRSIVAAQRLHHHQPLAFTRKGFVERNWSTWMVALGVSGLWLLLFGPSFMWGAATVGGMVSAMVHGLSHQPQNAGKVCRVLQQIGLIQSPKHHSVHHRPPHDCRYCPLTDWLNPLLDELRVWAVLEAGVRKLGLRPAN